MDPASSVSGPRRPPLRAVLGLPLAPIRWLERARGRRRWALAGLYLLVGGALAALAVRGSSLRGLPDVGDPFDAAAFRRAHEVPDAEDAFTLYRAAIARFKPIDLAAFQRTTPRPNDPWDWATASASTRAWAEANRAPLALFLRGADRARASRGRDGPAGGPVDHAIRELSSLALLDGSRRRGEGDRVGAWDEYRAVLRASRHAGAGGDLLARATARDSLVRVIIRLQDWADDPRLDAGTLRRASAEARACAAMTAPDADTIKAEYLTLIGEVDRFEPKHFINLDNEFLWYEHEPRLLAARLWWEREPERARRIVRLVLANWLAAFEAPGARLPAATRPNLRLFQLGPGAPPAARALTPAELDAWRLRSRYADALLSNATWSLGSFAGERDLLGGLEVLLAEQAFRRDRGDFPATLGELVGSYLDRLPEGHNAADASTLRPRTPAAP